MSAVEISKTEVTSPSALISHKLNLAAATLLIIKAYIFRKSRFTLKASQDFPPYRVTGDPEFNSLGPCDAIWRWRSWQHWFR